MVVLAPLAREFGGILAGSARPLAYAVFSVSSIANLVPKVQHKGAKKHFFLENEKADQYSTDTDIF